MSFRTQKHGNSLAYMQRYLLYICAETFKDALLGSRIVSSGRVDFFAGGLLPETPYNFKPLDDDLPMTRASGADNIKLPYPGRWPINDVF
jgi:hypothetical protein